MLLMRITDTGLYMGTAVFNIYLGSQSTKRMYKESPDPGLMVSLPYFIQTRNIKKRMQEQERMRML